MTEQTTTRGPSEASGAEERPRCQMGSKTDHPCWREATKQAWPDTSDFEVCAEHFRSIQLGYELDELLCDLDRTGAWIATWDDPKVGETRLQHHAFAMRSKMEEELWRVAVKDKAAELIARQGPDEEPLTLEQAQRLAEPWLRCDALMNACAALEDIQAVPETAFGAGSRWTIVAALNMACEEASAEHKRQRQRIGSR